MTIGRINHGKLVRNAVSVGAQRQVVKKREIKGEREQEEIQVHRDSITLTDQAKKGQKAGEATGETGRKGAKETGKDEASGRKKKSEKHLEVTTEEKIDTLKKQGEEIESTIEPGAPANADGKAGALPGTASMSHKTTTGSETQGSPGNIPGNGEQPPSSQYTEAANQQKLRQDDLQNAQTVYMQIAADRQKWMMKMWEIIQDTQTKMMEIMEGVALRRSQTMDSIATKWAACLGEYKL